MNYDRFKSWLKEKQYAKEKVVDKRRKANKVARKQRKGKQ